MGSPTSVTTENPQPHRKGGTSCSKETPTAVLDDSEAAYSNDERTSRRPWPSEVPDRAADGNARRNDSPTGRVGATTVRLSAREDALSTTPEEVLSYWFPEGFNEADPQTRRRQAQRWMAGGPEVDREITERFGETLEKARRGELDHWA
jgi:Bacterial protein of unknown function (DUF924)